MIGDDMETTNISEVIIMLQQFGVVAQFTLAA